MNTQASTSNGTDAKEVTVILLVGGGVAVVLGVLALLYSRLDASTVWEGASAMLLSGVLLLLGGVALVGAMVVKGVAGSRR